MSKNYCLAQDLKELKYILNKINNIRNLVVIPLNLETLLFLIKKKINYLDLKYYINNNLHKKVLLDTEKILKKIKITKIDDYTRITFLRTLRFRHYSYFFLKIILKKINIKNNTKFIISGWKSSDNLKSYIVSDLISLLVKKKNIKFISLNNNNLKKKRSKYIYQTDLYLKKQVFFKRKRIILNDLHYNFKRLIYLCFFKNVKFYFPTFKKVNLLRKVIYFFLKINPIYINKKISKQKIYKKNFEIKSSNKITNFFIKRLLIYFDDVFEKNTAIQNILNKGKFDIALSNNSIAPYATLNYSENNNHNSVCIPHGTIVRSFNVYDSIYKKNIAEAVFGARSKYYAVQSKLCKESLKTHKIGGKPLVTGNLIFSNYFAFFKKKNKKKNILIASTQKDFFNMHFLGVEMFYEIYDNLVFFNNLAKKNNYNYILKLHPSEFKNAGIVKKLFPNLLVETNDISKLLNKSDVLVSFSSTVIEDALNSRVPVILFDRFSRYQHCSAEKNINIKNKAVYYLNNKNLFLDLLNTIFSSKNYNFNKYIYNSNPYKNFARLLSFI